MQFPHQIINNTLFHSVFKDLDFFMHTRDTASKHPHETGAGAAANQVTEYILICIDNYVY